MDTERHYLSDRPPGSEELRQEGGTPSSRPDPELRVCELCPHRGSCDECEVADDPERFRAIEKRDRWRTRKWVVATFVALLMVGAFAVSQYRIRQNSSSTLTLATQIHNLQQERTADLATIARQTTHLSAVGKEQASFAVWLIQAQDVTYQCSHTPVCPPLPPLPPLPGVTSK